MSKLKPVDIGKIYLSERLERCMDKVFRYPLTVIEAPMGYGKTTSLQYYIKKHQTSCVWQSVMDSSTTLFWSQFCACIRTLDEKTGSSLMQLGFPSDSVTACEASVLIRDMKLGSDVLFVLDDYHLVSSDALDCFFEILAREESSDLHVVLLSRHCFNRNREELQVKNMLCIISQSELAFTEIECAEYYRECGVDLSLSQRMDLYKETEGWAAALYLILKYQEESGKLSVPDTLYDMLERSVYRVFSEDQKDFLLRICIFYQFSREQARFVRRKDDPSELLDNIVKTNGFIKYDNRKRRYHIHILFSRFLREQLEKRDIRFQSEVYRHAADWHQLNREYYFATKFYYRSGNFNDMMKCFEEDRGTNFNERRGKSLIRAFEDCPDEIRERHPIAVMIYAKQLYMMDEKERLLQVLRELEEKLYIQAFSERDRRFFHGEYLMLRGFLSFNDLSLMLDYQRQAAKYLTSASAIEDRKGNWTYGSPSVLYMYYRVPGSLNRLVDEMYASRDLYYYLADNNGRGGEYILDAEGSFYRNQLDRAEILSYKAYNVARKYEQTGIMISSLFLQARIFLLKGKADQGIDHLQNIRRLIQDKNQYAFRQTADLCKGFVYANYGQLRSIDPWLLDGDFDHSEIYASVSNFVYIVYGKILIESGSFSKYLGIVDMFLESAERGSNLLAEIYFEIFSAIAYSRLKMQAESVQSLQRAVSRATGDDLVMPFVENGKQLFQMPEWTMLDETEVSFLERCLEVYKRYEKKLGILLKEENGSMMEQLTKRESEIVRLVAEGKKNLEIARELNVAEITVKKSLSNIYARFGVPNRTSLLKKISQ